MIGVDLDVLHFVFVVIVKPLLQSLGEHYLEKLRPAVDEKRERGRKRVMELIAHSTQFGCEVLVL